MEKTTKKEEWLQQKLQGVTPSNFEPMPSPFLFGKIRAQLHRSNTALYSCRQLVMAGLCLCLLFLINISAIYYVSTSGSETTSVVPEAVVDNDNLYSYTEIYY